MDSAQSAVTKVIAAKRPKRRIRTAEEKKRIVEETMAKGGLGGAGGSGSWCSYQSDL